MFSKIVKNRHFVRYLAVSIILGLIVGIFTFNSILYSLDGRTTDAIYQYNNPSRTPIYVIAIDERTIEEYGHPNYWDRSVYADLLEKLYASEYKPSVTTFDILFSGNRSEEGDRQLADVCRECGNVIVGMKIDFDEEGMTDNKGTYEIDGLAIRSISYPYDELNAAAETAYVNADQDFDGVMRYAQLTHSVNGVVYDSLATASYRKYCEYNGLPVRDFSAYNRLKTCFTYSNKPETIESISVCDILDGRYDKNIQQGQFDGAILLVGAYAEGLQDAFTSPVDKKNQMYGVAVHSEIIRALETGALQLKPNEAQLTVVSVIYGLISAILLFVLLNVSLPIGGAVAGGSLILLTVACIIFYRNGLYLPYIYPVLAIAIAYIAMVFIHYLSVRLEKAKINNAFKMYVSPQVVDEVSKSGTYELKLGGQTKDIACLFIDIRGFTTMSEGLDPETVVGILNEYFAVITDAIFKNEGTLDKFIGDAAMAVYNSPFDLDDYEMRAIRSAMDIAKNSETLRNKLLERFGRTINFGIGINCGPATIGNIGCDFRMDFTAIGDTVNTASRLESNAKAGQILISEAMYERVKDRVEVEDVGGLALKGKANVIHTYNVLSIKEE